MRNTEVAAALRKTAAWIDRGTRPGGRLREPYFTPCELHSKWLGLHRMLGKPVGYCAIGYAAQELGLLKMTTRSTSYLVISMAQTSGQACVLLKRAHIYFDMENYPISAKCLREAADVLDPTLPVKREQTPHILPEWEYVNC